MSDEKPTLVFGPHTQWDAPDVGSSATMRGVGGGGGGGGGSPYIPPSRPDKHTELMGALARAEENQKKMIESLARIEEFLRAFAGLAVSVVEFKK